MNKQLKRLYEIGQSLKETHHARALLGLGSCGSERERLDEYSDLDFFVICQAGYKRHFIENLYWLENIHPILYSFQNTKDGYKLLYSDDIFCEFAIFEEDELKDIPFSKGEIIWKDEAFDDSICKATVNETKTRNTIDYLINEALTNLYIGVGRFHRGEKLSANNFIQRFAFDRILDLMTYIEKPHNSQADLFSISRRFESRYPEMSRHIPDMLLGYDDILISAENILKFLDSNFNIHQGMKQKILRLMNKEEN